MGCSCKSKAFQEVRNIGVKEQKNLVKVKASQKTFTGYKDECNKNVERFSDTVTN